MGIKLKSSLDHRPLWHLFVLVFLIAAAIRIGVLTISQEEYTAYLKGDVEARNIALSIARTGNFADPYGVPTGETAHLEPLSPFLESLIFRIWGITDRADFLRGIACALISSLTCGLTVLFGIEIGLGRLVSLCAGMIAALAPHGIQFRADISQLGGCLGTAFLICALLVMLQAVKHGPSPLRLAVCGVLSGLTILTYNSLLAPLALFMACAALPAKWNPLRLPLTSVFVIALLASLVVMPWSVRNLLVFKEWVTVRSNFGLEFRIGQNDFSDPWQIHPYNSKETRDLIRRVGEPAAFAALGRDGREWVQEHPIKFVRRTLKRVYYFWIPRDRYIASFVVALCAFYGFLLLVIQKHPAALIVGMLWLAYPAVYYLLQSLPRYQQPIGFSLYLMASVPIPGLLTKIGWREVDTNPIKP